MQKTCHIFLLAALAGIACRAQTQVDLQTKGKNIDFSAAPSIKHFKARAALLASTGYFTTSLSNLAMAGCSAGNVLDILLTKSSTNGADHVYGAYLTIVRNL